MATKADIEKAEENLRSLQEEINSHYKNMKNSLFYRMGVFCFEVFTGENIDNIDSRKISEAREGLQRVRDDYDFSRGYD